MWHDLNNKKVTPHVIPSAARDLPASSTVSSISIYTCRYVREGATARGDPSRKKTRSQITSFGICEENLNLSA